MNKNKKLLVFAIFIAIMAIVSETAIAAPIYFTGQIDLVAQCRNNLTMWLVRIPSGKKIDPYYYYYVGNPTEAIKDVLKKSVGLTITGFIGNLLPVVKLQCNYYNPAAKKYYTVNLDAKILSFKSAAPPAPPAGTTPTAPTAPGEPTITTEIQPPQDIIPTSTPSTPYEYPSYFELQPTTPVSGYPTSSYTYLEPSLTGQIPEIPTKTVEFPFTATVNVKTLRVRTEPKTSAPLGGSKYLYNGDKFTATSYAVGEKVEGEDRWWISSKGNYVWVGGTIEKPY